MAASTADMLPKRPLLGIEERLDSFSLLVARGGSSYDAPDSGFENSRPGVYGGRANL
jgi:hypothetical protein